VTNLVTRSTSDTDVGSHSGRSRRAWPFVVSILVGLTLLYFAPRETLIAALTLLAATAGVVFVQRRQRRRQANVPT